MSALALSLRPAAGALSLAQRAAAWRRGDPVFFGLGLLLLALALPTGFAALLDDRQFGGANIWLKPFKFELALAVYALTLALYGHFLPAGLAGTRPFRVYRGAVAAAVLAELAWIAAAAALGTASHFNTSPAGQVVYPVMGFLALLLTSASAVFAYGIARNKRTGLSPGLKESLVWGLALVLPLTLVTAGTMSANDGHLVGASGAAGGFAFFGWSRQAGDLRVAHFFATHALHFIPLFGLLAERAWGGTSPAPVRLFAAGFALFVAFVFVQALNGMPFLPLVG